MSTTEKTAITVTVHVKAPLDKVWAYWSEPQHITKWYQASDDWHAPHAENDLKVGGHFKTTMAAKDGSMSFDFEGDYTQVQQHKAISYNIIDGRKVTITFEEQAGGTQVVETFDPEQQNPYEMQKGGWQAILDHFKKYIEGH